MAVKPIIHDELSLKFKSMPATKQDLTAAKDLKDTLLANNGKAAGLAANMIGVQKRIITLFVGPLPIVILNPIIVSKSDKYLAYEGCLSLQGERPTERYKKITVKYQNENFETRQQEFSDFVAEVIQHEVDHCNGILI